MALLDRVYQTGETYFGIEVPVQIPGAGQQDPRDSFFTFTYQAFREAGRIVGISVFAYDVTEQVLARRGREAERQQLHRLFAQAPVAISILDGPEFVFEFLNPRYQQFLPGRPLLGLPIMAAVPELAASPIPDQLRRVYATGDTHEEQGILVRLAAEAGGEVEDRYFTFLYQARHDERGHVDGVLVFVFELSEQMQARRASEASAQQALVLAQELAAANQQLTRTNVDLDNFIYTASHDLKAPITNIEDLLDTLRYELPEQAPTSEVAYILELKHDSVHRFKRTIDHLTT